MTVGPQFWILACALLCAANASCSEEASGSSDPCGPGEVPLGAGDCLKLQDVDAGLSIVVDDDAGDDAEGGAP